MEGSVKSQNANYENFSKILNWEVFWNENKKEIEEELLKALQVTFASDPVYYTEDEKKEVFEERINAEKEFSRILLQSLSGLLERNKKILMLFDVDETIGKAFYDKKNVFHTVIRPAFLLIMKRLQDLRTTGKVDVGLLTTRGELRKQLEDPENLQPIKEIIHPDHLYSARGVTLGYDNENGCEVLEDRSKESSVLRTNILENEAFQLRNSGTLKKLTLLQEIRVKNSGKLFLVVDDDRYPSFLDEEKGFIGIGLDRDTMFSLR